MVGSPGQQQQQPTNGQVGGPGSQQSIGVQPQQAAYAVQPGGYPGASQQAYAGHTSYQQYAQQGAATYAMNGGAGGRVRGPASAAAAAAAAGYAAYAQQPRQLGRVKWFDRDRKQYGFITPADGSPDLFMHAGDVLGSTKLLGPGDPVEFDYGVQTQSGRPKALEVARLVQHLGDEEEDDGRTTIGKFASGDEPLFDGARVTGTIARFDQQHRWGFIAPDNETLKPPNGGDNFFVHGLDVLDISDSNPVEVGQAVEFSVVKNRVRKYKAVQCLRVNADAREDSHPATATGTEGESAEGGEQTATAETTAENDDDDEAAATATPPASPSRAAAAAAETANAKKNSPQEQQATADDATTTTNNNSEDSIKDSNEASGDGAGAAETVVVAE